MPANDRTAQPGLPDVRVTPEVMTAWGEPLEALVSRRPRAGELWRLEFNGAATLALVLDRDESELLVAAVGDDPEYADHATLLITADESPVGYAVGVWTSVTMHVPDFVAERPLGTLLDADLGHAASLHDWLTYGRPCDVASDRRGRPVGDGHDLVVDYRLALRDEIEHVGAPAIELTRRAEQDDEPEVPEPSLGSLLRAANVPTSQLAEVLGWPRERARGAYRDTVFLDEGDVGTLAELLSVSPDVIRASVPIPPPALVVAVHRPSARALVQELSDQRGVPAVAARRAATEGALALQPRATGPRVDWDQVLADYFHGVLQR